MSTNYGNGQTHQTLRITDKFWSATAKTHHEDPSWLINPYLTRGHLSPFFVHLPSFRPCAIRMLWWSYSHIPPTMIQHQPTSRCYLHIFIHKYIYIYMYVPYILHIFHIYSIYIYYIFHIHPISQHPIHQGASSPQGRPNCRRWTSATPGFGWEAQLLCVWSLDILDAGPGHVITPKKRENNWKFEGDNNIWPCDVLRCQKKKTCYIYSIMPHQKCKKETLVFQETSKIRWTGLRVPAWLPSALSTFSQLQRLELPWSASLPTGETNEPIAGDILNARRGQQHAPDEA